MRKIELPDAYENYSFEYIGDGVYYSVRLHTFRGLLYADVYVNNELVVAGVRCISGAWLIPFRDRRTSGNFKFVDTDGSYPESGNFGKSCNLYFYGEEEL